APAGPKERLHLVPAQRTAAGYYVLTRGFMLSAFVGLLPYLLYRILAFTVIELSGALAAFSAFAFLTARYSQVILARFGIQVVMYATAVLLTGAFLVFALWENPTASVVAMAIMGGASGAVRPVTIRSLSHISSTEPGAPPMGRVVGAMERAFGLGNALVIFLGGILIVQTSFRTGMLVLAAVYVAGQGVLLASSRPRVAVTPPVPVEVGSRDA
ncbi:MAG: MFS transporter, partial [Frankia sp.]